MKKIFLSTVYFLAAFPGAWPHTVDARDGVDTAAGYNRVAYGKDHLQGFSLEKLKAAREELERLGRTKNYYIMKGIDAYFGFLAQDTVQGVDGNRRVETYGLIADAGGMEFTDVYERCVKGIQPDLFGNGATVGMNMDPAGSEAAWAGVRDWAGGRRLSIDESAGKITCLNCSKDDLDGIYADVKDEKWAADLKIDFIALPCYAPANKVLIDQGVVDVTVMKKEVGEEIKKREGNAEREKN